MGFAFCFKLSFSKFASAKNFPAAAPITNPAKAPIGKNSTPPAIVNIPVTLPCLKPSKKGPLTLSLCGMYEHRAAIGEKIYPTNNPAACFKSSFSMALYIDLIYYLPILVKNILKWWYLVAASTHWFVYCLKNLLYFVVNSV